MRYADPDWMLRLLLSLGGEVAVERPAILAERLHERAQATLRLAGQLTAT